MRILIALVLVTAVGWSAYWVYGSRTLESAVRDGIESLRENTVEVEVAHIAVTGFPNRFDTMIDAPRLTWPSGVSWSAPFLQVFALSYRPNQIILAFPSSQVVSGSFGTATIDVGRARASALFRHGADLFLDHAYLVADDLRIAVDGQFASAVKFLAATRIPEGASAETQNIGLTIDDVELPVELARRLGRAETARIDGATLDATVTLAEPVTRRAIESGGLRVRHIKIDRLHIDWGGMSVGGNGAIGIATDGMFDGTLDVSITNWKRALQMAEASGLLPSEQRLLIEKGADAMAALSGRGDRLEAPVTFRAGRTWLGPLQIGPAPRL